MCEKTLVVKAIIVLTENKILFKMLTVMLWFVTLTLVSLDLMPTDNFTSMCTSSTVCHHLPQSVLQGIIPLFSSKKLEAILRKRIVEYCNRVIIVYWSARFTCNVLYRTSASQGKNKSNCHNWRRQVDLSIRRLRDFTS